MIEWQDHERIIVCGSRSFADYALLNRVMDRLTRKFVRVVVLSDARPGASALGERWAVSWWWSVLRFHPDREKYHKAAEAMQIRDMVAAATRCVAFEREGDAECWEVTRACREREIPTKVIYYEGE